MLSASFTFGSHNAYSVHALSLSGTAHELKIEFQDGEHVFTSQDFVLGTIHAMRDRPLIGRLVFRYTYDKSDGVERVTVCDEDYESADGMTLMTFPQGCEDASCFERASGAGFAADEIHHNGLWNTRSLLFPGVSRLLKDVARDAARALITALAAHDNIILKLRTPFPELALEDYNKLCIVFRDDETPCTYDEMLRSDKGPFVIWDVYSQFDGKAQLPLNATFANVIGSTGDKLPNNAGSWIQLWRTTTGLGGNDCASLKYPTSVAKCEQGAKTLGGHIILKAAAASVDRGSDDVRIIPICYAHNSTSFTGAMRAWKERWVVCLSKYHNP